MLLLFQPSSRVPWTLDTSRVPKTENIRGGTQCFWPDTCATISACATTGGGRIILRTTFGMQIDQ